MATLPHLPQGDSCGKRAHVFEATKKVAISVLGATVGWAQGSKACWSFAVLQLRFSNHERIRREWSMSTQQTTFVLCMSAFLNVGGHKGARLHLGLMLADCSRTIGKLPAKVVLLPLLLFHDRIAIY